MIAPDASSRASHPALELAALGMRAFPAHNVHKGRCSCNNPHCENPGKHPRFGGWQTQATTDPSQIRRWIKQLPFANWGYAIDGLVLDVDPRNGGSESLEQLQRDHGPLPDTWRVLTGGGGEHHYFALPENVVVKSGGLAGYPGLDIKTVGSLVIAPGSVHASGRRYEWDGAAHPEDIPRAQAPTFLVDLARQPRTIATAAASDDAPITQNRNDTLTSLGGKLRHAGLSRGAIEAALLVTNEERCQPPLPDSEVCSIAKSVARYPAGTLPPPPTALVEVESRAQRASRMQSATMRATAHPRGRKYVPVTTRLAAAIAYRKEQGKAPDTEDGLYYIPKDVIGGHEYGTDKWEIAEATVRNHLGDLREFAPHIPGFRAAKRPINFPRKAVDLETGEVKIDPSTGKPEMIDRYEMTWCYNFDGDPAQLVDALPTLPYPEDGRGKRCNKCGAEKKTKSVDYCPDCEIVQVIPKPEDPGVNFTPPISDGENDSAEGARRAFAPIGIEEPGSSMGGHTYPLPLDDDGASTGQDVNFTPSPLRIVEDPWDRLYDRAKASSPRIGSESEPQVRCTFTPFGCQCPHPDRCSEQGRCSP